MDDTIEHTVKKKKKKKEEVKILRHQLEILHICIH
jgi:hypothetical protein